MGTIFINSKNSKTSHRLLLNPTDKINLREVMNMLVYQTLVFPMHGKI